jgi:hypothetical protein
MTNRDRRRPTYELLSALRTVFGFLSSVRHANRKEFTWVVVLVVVVQFSLLQKIKKGRTIYYISQQRDNAGSYERQMDHRARVDVDGAWKLSFFFCDDLHATTLQYSQNKMVTQVEAVGMTRRQGQTG